MDDLFESSKALLDQVSSVATMEQPLSRELTQILVESRKLLSKAGGGDPQASNTQARVFLAQQGIDAERQAAQIQNLDMKDAFMPLEMRDDTDVEGYLRDDHEKIVVQAIEEGRQETLKAFEDSVLHALEADWIAAKEKLLQDLGFSGGRTASLAHASVAGGSSAMVWSSSSSVPGLFMNEPSIPGSLPLQMHARMMAYAANVEQLNNARVKNEKFSMANAGSATSKLLDPEARISAMAECWETVIEIIGGVKKALKPKLPSVHALYDDQTIEINQALTLSSRSFLEKQFAKFLDNRIHQSISGKPDFKNKIEAYVNIVLPRLKEQDRRRIEPSFDNPIWAILYYLVRCGYYDVAKRLVQEDFRDYFTTSDANFAAAFVFFVDSPDHSIPNDLRKMIVQTFSQFQLMNRHDIFKQALYKIVGRCDLNTKTIPEVIQSTEDYLWLQLHLIRDHGRSASDEISSSMIVSGGRGAGDYTLKGMQELLLKYGPKHFNPKNTNPIKYTQVLLLSGQFEQAVQYLFLFPSHEADAVHIAIALMYEGLLRVSTSPATSEFLSEKGKATLDIASMVNLYTKAFVNTNPDKAFHYYLALGAESLIEPTRKYLKETANTLIRQLMLDTRQFSLLVGEVLPDGTVTQADILTKFASLLGVTNLREELVKQAAVEAEQAGRLDDAVQLYNLAKCHGDVIKVQNRRLGEKLLTFSPQDVQDARQVIAFYQSKGFLNSNTVDPGLVSTAQTLLDIMQAFTEARDQHYEQALKLLEKTGLLPFGDDRNDEKIKRFDMQDQSIKLHFGDILLLAEECLFNSFKRLASSGRQPDLDRIRRYSNNIVAFTGSLRMRLSQDVYGRIMQMDVSMA